MARLSYLSRGEPQDWKEANTQAAAEMARQGFPVFPCSSSGDNFKGALVKWAGWAPDNWQAVKGIWRRYPLAIPGMSLAPHRLLVIDPDVKSGIDGLKNWRDLCQGRPMPRGIPEVSTPTGGLHAYFRQPDGLELGNSRGQLPAGIDVRGLRGYVIAPGATLPDGRQWGYASGTIFSDAPELPDWLIEILVQKEPEHEQNENIVRFDDAATSAYFASAFHREIDSVRKAGPGTRNEALNAAAFALRQLVNKGGLRQDEVETGLWEAARDNGLVKDDGVNAVRATMRSGFAAADRKPRPDPEIRARENLTEIPRSKPITEADITEALRFYFEGEQEKVEREAIIHGVVPTDGIFLISGHSKSGKSFIAVDFALSVASGQPFWGYPIEKRMGVAYLATEGAGGIDNRIEAAKKFRGIEDGQPIAVFKNPGQINDPETFKTLISDLKLANEIMLRRWGVPLGIVILDTLTKGLIIKDMNDTPEATRHMLFLEHEFEKALGVLFVAIHHIPKAARFGALGSQVYTSYPETVMEVVCDRDEKTNKVEKRTLFQTKNKEGEEIEFGEFSLEKVSLGADSKEREIASVAIKRVMAALQPDWDKICSKLGKSEKGVLAALQAALDSGAWFDYPVSGYSPETMVTVRAVTYDDLHATMQRTYNPEGTPRQIHDRVRKAIQTATPILEKSGKIGCGMHGTDGIFWLT